MPDTDTGTSWLTGLGVVLVIAVFAGALSSNGGSNPNPHPVRPTPTVTTTDDNRDQLELIVESSEPNAGISVKITGDIHTSDHYPQKVGIRGRSGHRILRDTITFNPRTPGTFEVRVKVLSRPNLPGMWHPDFVSCIIRRPGETSHIDDDHAETQRTKVTAAIATCRFKTPLGTS